MSVKVLLKLCAHLSTAISDNCLEDKYIFKLIGSIWLQGKTNKSCMYVCTLNFYNVRKLSQNLLFEELDLFSQLRYPMI